MPTSEARERKKALFSHGEGAGPRRPAPIHLARLPLATAVFVLVAVVSAVSVVWIDRPLARAIARLLHPGNGSPMQVPDLLLWFVVAVTAGSFLVWIWGYWRGTHPRLLRLAPLLMLAEPLSLGVKYLAKWAFGRTQTQLYVHHPWAHDFHWLHGHGPYLGFPSGHMLVATALIMLVVAVYPRLRPLGWLALLLLAAALMLTSYHYLGDVIAGWLIGATLAWFILAADARLRPAESPQTPS